MSNLLLSHTGEEPFFLKNLYPTCNVLGIDLGTTNTVIAAWIAGRRSPEIVTSENDDQIIPSYVWCKNDGTFEVGKKAVRNLALNSQDVCYDSKQMIGKTFTDIDMTQYEYSNFKIANENGFPVYELSDGRKISPQEITTQILKYAKNIAEKFVGVALEYAVITIPNSFNQLQRQATLDAATSAGLSVLSLESRSIAAAYTFLYKEKHYDNSNIFVFCLGGETLDVSIITIRNESISVIPYEGDDNLGVRDFDNLIIQELKTMLEKYGAQNLDDVKQKIKLQKLAEATKVALKTTHDPIVNFNEFMDEDPRIATIDNDYSNIRLKRSDFEALAHSLIEKLEAICIKALRDAKITAEDITQVIAADGASQMPFVENLLKNVFRLDLDQIYFANHALDPDTAAAFGAAIFAARLSSTNILPLSIGIELFNDEHSIIFSKGTVYPIKIKKQLFTTENDQEFLSMSIYVDVKNPSYKNPEILKFIVPNLPPGIAGDVNVDVTFEMDKKGLLRITGKAPTSVVRMSADYHSALEEHDKEVAKKSQNLIKEREEVIKPLKFLIEQLTQRPYNFEQKKIFEAAKLELRNIIENKKRYFQYKNFFPFFKIHVNNCEKIIQWLDNHPDEPLDGDTTEILKQIEKHFKEVIGLKHANQYEKKLIKGFSMHLKEVPALIPVAKTNYQKGYGDENEGTYVYEKNISSHANIDIKNSRKEFMKNTKEAASITVLKQHRGIDTSFSYTEKYQFPQKFFKNNKTMDAVGIDFGNTNCLVAVNRNNGIEIIHLGHTSERKLLSYVSYDEINEKCDKVVVGRLLWHSKSTVHDFKKIIGKKFTDIEIDKNWPFKLVNDHLMPKIEVHTFNGKQIVKTQKDPDEVLAELFKYMKKMCEEFQGRHLIETVIAVPLYFNEKQRAAVKSAAFIAGWVRIHFLPDPIAAVFAYFDMGSITKYSTILTFDLGGSSLQICVLKIYGNEIQIIGHYEDIQIGGKSFDIIIKNYVQNRLKQKYEHLNFENQQHKFDVECEEIKKNLFPLTEREYIYDDARQKIDYASVPIDYEKFVNQSQNLLNKIREDINAALNKVNLNHNEIDMVLQVGGGCRMQIIKELVIRTFSNAEHCCHAFPEELVASGAARYAYDLISSSQI